MKWVDYTKKYGMGYVLSNNLVGVYFNDLSTIINNPCCETNTIIDYITRGLY
jgi:polo-like kinase 1